ncbi:hypothetical protein [Mesorhizobium sp. INR15]|uniref:hypothetical protein n=1 Tax=Mesorhizobium sp. INR15 TaxID=2654248 RepID=UPI0018964BCA|nr:hypothetical protein [Mesorhizobium sp. INR15]QPC94746.1 hypothetical protein GA829_31430 [Mesorhizobium sp. INR15]
MYPRESLRRNKAVANNSRPENLAPLDGSLEYEREISRLFASEPKWRIAPFAVAYVKENKSRVYFDYDNRPILRVGPDHKNEITPPGTMVCFSMLADLHAGSDGRPDPDGRKIVTDLIAKYGLSPELRRRWYLFQRGTLPEPAWGSRS